MTRLDGRELQRVFVTQDEFLDSAPVLLVKCSRRKLRFVCLKDCQCLAPRRGFAVNTSLIRSG